MPCIQAYEQVQFVVSEAMSEACPLGEGSITNLMIGVTAEAEAAHYRHTRKRQPKHIIHGHLE